MIVLGDVICVVQLNVIVITDPPANPVPVTVIGVDDGLVWRMLFGVIVIIRHQSVGSRLIIRPVTGTHGMLPAGRRLRHGEDYRETSGGEFRESVRWGLERGLPS